jgi:OmpA-OmpF porin, OOP family
MKKLAIALATAAATVLSTGAMAQAYVGAGVGAANIDIDCEGADSCDNSSTGGKVYGGYNFGNGFGAEVGYISFGEASASVEGISAKAKVNGFTVGVAYRAALGPNWGLTTRLGVASLKTKISASAFGFTGSDDETHTGPYFGIAGDYALTQNLKLEVSADFSKAKYDSEKANVRTVNVGVRFDF